jgi:glycosyltransferase involved in cell wall biosynthesis/O-antigen ligase
MSTLTRRGLDPARRDRAALIAAALAAAAVATACGALIATGHVALVCGVVVGGAAAAAIVAHPERAALLLLGSVPFLVYPVSAGTLSVFLGLPFGLLVGVALLARAAAPGQRVRPVLPAFAFGALVSIGALSAAVSVNPTVAASRVLYLLMFGLLAAALAHAVTRGLIALETLVKAIVIGAALAALALTVQSLAQFVVGREVVTDWLLSVTTTFGGQNSAGTSQEANWYVPSVRLLRGVFPFMTSPSAGQYMMLGLLSALWLRRQHRTRLTFSPRVETIGLVLLLSGLVLTLSRQAWLGAIVGVLLITLDARRLRLTVVIVCVGLGVGLVPIPDGGGQTVGGYLLASSETGSKSNAERVGLWNQAIELTKEDPVLGVGPGLVGTLNPDASNKVFYAHNIVLDAAVEMGVPGALALVALLLGGMVIAWRHKQRLGLALIAAYAVANMFDDVLYFPRNGILLAAGFAIAAVPLARVPAVAAASSGPEVGGAPEPPDDAPPPEVAPVQEAHPVVHDPAPLPPARPQRRAPAVLMIGKGWFPDQEGGLNRYFRSLFECSTASRAVVVGPAVESPPRVRAVARHDDPLLRRLIPFTRATLAAARHADVVNAHFPLYAFLPVCLGVGGKPLVAHFHGPWADEALSSGRASVAKAAVERAIERRVYSRAAAVIVLSNAFRDLLVEQHGVPAEKVRVVRPGVDLELFSPGSADEASQRLGIEGGRPIAVTARRLVPRMGIDVLIEAWSSVVADAPASARPLLLVIGQGHERPRLEAHADELGVNDYIRFLGKVSDRDLVAAYRAARVAVAPSVALEGFGLVTLEALACGTPVVATDVGGLPEALEGLDRSLVVPPRDAGALALRLRGAFSGEQAVPSRARCRAYAETFTWERTAREVEAVYSSLLRPSGGSAGPG